jgi:enoyl-CoA hydratase/carnithine racemase
LTEEVIVSQHDGVMRIIMHRPQKKNALTGAMYDKMTASLEEAESDDSIRAILLKGSGDAFTGGNDLADFLAVSREGGEPSAAPFIRKIALLDKPIVAAVNGVAVGVGATLLFHCDLVYASPSAKFRMPFVDLGLVPEAGSSVTVPARVGLAKASEFLLLADGFDAHEAYRLGIVNAVVPPDQLSDTAFKAASRLAAKPAGALRATRRLIRGDRANLIAAIDRELEAFAAALASAEARAAFGAFLTKGKA